MWSMTNKRKKRKEAQKASKLTLHTCTYNTSTQEQGTIDEEVSHESHMTTFEGIHCIQWSLSNKDTLGTEGSVLISEVS